MTSTRLAWQDLQPDSNRYQYIFDVLIENNDSLSIVQPRLLESLKHLYHKIHVSPFLLLNSQDSKDYYTWIKIAAEKFQPKKTNLFGGSYHINDNNQINLHPPNNSKDPFTSNGGVHYAYWIELEELFGCIRFYKNNIKLEPGLIHRANGGTLILPIKIFLAKPFLWSRLRKYIMQNRFDWHSQNESQPLPISIPSIPLDIKLILCGNRNILADFYELDNEIYKIAIYSEFEEEIKITKDEDITAWCQWTMLQAKLINLPKPTVDFWPQLINEAVRMTGHQNILPLCPCWLRHQLQYTAMYSNTINAQAFEESLEKRLWIESSLSDRIRDDILLNQTMINTEGNIIGQINSLSVVEFPGHPRPWGEPSRITCIVYFGNGEFTDVEHKSELSGNIHTKGMMIIQAYLVSELKLDQQFPFSSSLVFEQSYSEVDGDSASLAELCVLISALANKPLTQQIAVTGSVDQLGNVQPVSGLNEKIECFFHICHRRRLTGKQGVILPGQNVSHLSLSKNVVKAVKEKKFHIWAVDNVNEALLLLSGISWRNGNNTSLLNIIRERIIHLNKQETSSTPFLSWINWFNHS